MITQLIQILKKYLGDFQVEEFGPAAVDSQLVEMPSS